jgi:hypothetical protein
MLRVYICKYLMWQREWKNLESKQGLGQWTQPNNRLLGLMCVWSLISRGGKRMCWNDRTQQLQRDLQWVCVTAWANAMYCPSCHGERRTQCECDARGRGVAPDKHALAAHLHCPAMLCCCAPAPARGVTHRAMQPFCPEKKGRPLHWFQRNAQGQRCKRTRQGSWAQHYHLQMTREVLMCPVGPVKCEPRPCLDPKLGSRIRLSLLQCSCRNTVAAFIL